MIAARKALVLVRVALLPLAVVGLIVHLVLGAMSGLFLIAGAIAAHALLAFLGWRALRTGRSGTG